MRRLTTIITTFIFCLFATIILYPSMVKADGTHFVSTIDVTDLNGPEDGHDHSIWVYHENDDNFLESYGGISYNPTTNVLTLNNVNGPGYFLMICGDYGSPTEVEIKVVGDNKLKGLWCFSSGVKFTGTGTLTIDQSATTTLDAATYTFNALNAIYIHQVEDKKLTIEKTVTLHLKSGTPGLGSGEGVIAVEGMTHQTLDSFLVYGGVVTPDMDTVFSANDEQIFIKIKNYRLWEAYRLQILRSPVSKKSIIAQVKR